MNKAILVGRLAKDPETRTTTTGKTVTTITLAVDRRFKQEGQPTADFIPCVAWGKTAEVIANNLSKGRKCGIIGSIQTRSYEARDGGKRYITEVLVDEMEFLDSKKDSMDSKNGQFGQFGQGVPDNEIPF